MDQRILIKLDELEQILSELRELFPATDTEYVNSKITQRAVERLIQISVECVIDVCAMLVKELRLGVPSSEADYFEKLEGIAFDHEMIEHLQMMRRFRNRIVHRYGDLNQAQVYEIVLQSFSDFERFQHHVQEYLKKSRNNPSP